MHFQHNQGNAKKQEQYAVANKKIHYGGNNSFIRQVPLVHRSDASGKNEMVDKAERKAKGDGKYHTVCP